MATFSRRIVASALFATLADSALATEPRFSWQAVERQPTDPISFLDAQGRPSDLGAYRGRTLLLNLWATWCAPCVLELPALDRLQRDLGPRTLTVLPLSLDRGGLPAVQMAYRRLKLTHLPQIVDPNVVTGSRLAVVGLPATFVVDRNGRFVASRRGAVEWDAPSEREQLKSWVAKANA